MSAAPLCHGLVVPPGLLAVTAAVALLQDLAVIMCVAGAVTLLFHKLKQPVVLGYILAGLMIGPHTPPVKFITDEHNIATLGRSVSSSSCSASGCTSACASSPRSA
jgi:hypothetical protein